MPKLVLKSEVAAHPDRLWKEIRPFSAIGDWNPFVEAVEAEGDSVGSLRTLKFEGAGTFVERLETINDRERLYVYSIVDSPLPINNCTVEIRVRDEGNGKSTVEWTSGFDSEAGQEFASVRAFQKLYQNALDNLQSLVSGK